MMSLKQKAYFGFGRLMAESPYHQNWTDAEIKRCIIPAIETGMFIMCYDEGEETKPYMVATFAFPEPRHIEEYLITGCFPADGFEGEGYEPWVIDFICLTGMRDIMRSFRYLKDMFGQYGYYSAQWLRTASDRRGWHEIKGV